MKKFSITSFYSLSLLASAIISFAIYMQFNYKIEQTNEKIIEHEIQKSYEYTQKISKILLKYSKRGLYTTLKRNMWLRRDLEIQLSILKSSKYINIFVVRKDKNGKIRYMLDAETYMPDKGEFDQKFDTQNIIWDKVFRTKSSQYGKQEYMDDLWITYLYPVIKDDKIIAVIAIDFSIETFDEIKSILKPIKEFLFLFALMTAFLFIINITQIYIHYKTSLKGYTDALTKTFNRQYLNKIEKTIKLDDYLIAIMDIDHFKKINDRYGHGVGDEVLQIITKRIQNRLKKDDILIRYGGEEFVIFVKKKDVNSAEVVFEKLRRSIQDSSIGIGDILLDVTASFGVNLNLGFSGNIKEALEIADKQLYRAKELGRNTVCYFPSVEDF